jgi:hypothetical protein
MATRKRKCIGRLDPISLKMKLLKVAATPQQQQAAETTQQIEYRLEKDRTTTATSRATRKRKCIGRLDPNSLRMKLLRVAETPQQRQQLYVACSRVGTPRRLYIFAPGGQTMNVVYQNALE